MSVLDMNLVKVDKPELTYVDHIQR